MNLSREALLKFLDYDQESGIFRHQHARRRVTAGSVAGTLRNGYIDIVLNGRSYGAHRLAWLYVHGVWPDGEIDHIDGNRTNNAISNLRVASHAQNLRNMRQRRDNTSGFKGVSLHRPTSRWRASIRVDGRKRHLGYFDDPQEAHEIYCLAADLVHGEFSNHGSRATSP